MKRRWSLATIGALMMLGGITGVASGQTRTFAATETNCSTEARARRSLRASR
jgi:hypothetical protein